MTQAIKKAIPTARDAQILVHVVARDKHARQRLSESLDGNPSLCVARSTLPGEDDDRLDALAPDAIVAYADSEQDCHRIHAMADRHPEAFCVLVLSDVDWPPESADTTNVNHIERAHPDVVRETLAGLLNGHARSDDAKATPAPLLQAVDQERLERLTAREREILILTAEGLSIDEIAKRLHRAFATVAKHRNNIMAKTGLRDRVALTRFAIRTGLASA